MPRIFTAALLTLALGLASTPAYAQTEGAAATDVASVTVTGRRRPPPEILPQSSSCVEGVNRDVSARALMAAGVTPRFYVPTRPMRNPDYRAPPKSPPGSAKPKVQSLKEWMRTARTDPLRFSGTSLPGAMVQTEGLGDGGGDGAGAGGGLGGGSLAGGGDMSREAAIAQCLAGSYGAGGEAVNMGWGIGADQESSVGSRPQPAFGAGRLQIKLNDTTLPMGFALFEEGRYAEALEEFLKAYKKLPDGDGGAEAALMIGKIYLDGLGDKSDPVQAVFWLKRAGGGRFEAWTQTPIFDPREPDRNTAMGEASLILADIYRTGRGPIAKDIDESVKQLKRAVYVGHVPAAKRLGDLYYEGVDTPRDLKAAFRHYMEGAKFAYAPAMNAVANMYETGEADGAPNPAKALAWRTEAASRVNDPESLYALAMLYDAGEGVTADPERALALYKIAAVNGHAGAQAAIGSFFYKGEAGVPHDPALARKWFEQAAKGADTDGMFNLAAMMAKGEGGEVDRVRAWGWFRIAHRGGHPNAAAAALALEAQMTPQDRAGMAQLTAKMGW